jgi:hypothetical protein
MVSKPVDNKFAQYLYGVILVDNADDAPVTKGTVVRILKVLSKEYDYNYKVVYPQTDENTFKYAGDGCWGVNKENIAIFNPDTISELEKVFYGI